MSPKIRLCREAGCSNQQTTKNYCRLHYLKNWRQIKAKDKEKAAKDLNNYVNAILKRNPDKGLQELKENLKDEDKFEQSVSEMVYEDELNMLMNDFINIGI